MKNTGHENKPGLSLEAQAAPLSRRKVLGALGALGVVSLWGCNGGDGSGSSSSGSLDTGSGSSSGSSDSDTTSSSATDCSSTSNCVKTPSEIEGPYPAYEKSLISSLHRTDITGGQTGVPLTLTLTLQDTNNYCTPIVGYAVYIWHCNKSGVYSAVTAATNDNGANHSSDTWLRGISDTNSNGQVTFTTIYPGWYVGRITHIHVQVYALTAAEVIAREQASSSVIVANSLAKLTTQLAFPQTITQAVYNSTLYKSHGQNTSVTSFSADNVFSDTANTALEMVSLCGDVSSGYTGNITIGIPL